MFGWWSKGIHINVWSRRGDEYGSRTSKCNKFVHEWLHAKWDDTSSEVNTWLTILYWSKIWGNDVWTGTMTGCGCLIFENVVRRKDIVGQSFDQSHESWCTVLQIIRIRLRLLFSKYPGSIIFDVNSNLTQTASISKSVITFISNYFSRIKSLVTCDTHEWCPLEVVWSNRLYPQRIKKFKWIIFLSMTSDKESWRLMIESGYFKFWSMMSVFLHHFHICLSYPFRHSVMDVTKWKNRIEKLLNHPIERHNQHVVLHSYSNKIGFLKNSACFDTLTWFLYK